MESKEVDKSFIKILIADMLVYTALEYGNYMYIENGFLVDIGCNMEGKVNYDNGMIGVDRLNIYYRDRRDDPFLTSSSVNAFFCKGNTMIASFSIDPSKYKDKEGEYAFDPISEDDLRDFVESAKVILL